MRHLGLGVKHSGSVICWGWWTTNELWTLFALCGRECVWLGAVGILMMLSFLHAFFFFRSDWIWLEEGNESKMGGEKEKEKKGEGMKICCATRTSGGSIRMVWVLATTAENKPVYLCAFVGGGDEVGCYISAFATDINANGIRNMIGWWPTSYFPTTTTQVWWANGNLSHLNSFWTSVEIHVHQSTHPCFLHVTFP